MIDDLATRSALTVAAFLFLTTGLSVLELSRDDAIRDAAQGLATHLARQLDGVGAIDAEATFRSDDGLFRWPPNLAGSPYRVEIRATDVRVIAGPVDAVVELHPRVHPFEPDQDAYAAEDLARRDAAVVVAGPGHPFVVERTARWVHGSPTFLTFVYLPR